MSSATWQELRTRRKHTYTLSITTTEVQSLQQCNLLSQHLRRELVWYSVAFVHCLNKPKNKAAGDGNHNGDISTPGCDYETVRLSETYLELCIKPFSRIL